MKRTNEDWSVQELVDERSRITFPEYQREKALWTTEKKGLLIDSILRNIDIPKLYFYLSEDKNIEVIDGQQRLWSIWQFFDCEFPYRIGSKGKEYFFSTLAEADKERFVNYSFQVTTLEEADEEYLRLLFVRLQLGLLLNTGEKLNAAMGWMKHLVFERLAKHLFIEGIGVPKRRYAKETLCAQVCINSFMIEKLGEFARTRYDDLENFFSEYSDPKGKDLEFFDMQSKVILNVFDQLGACFGNNVDNLRNRSYILSIYLFVEELIRKQGELSAKEQKLFSEFVFILWEHLREEARLGMDRTNRDLYEFQTYLSSAPGETYQIERRHIRLTTFYEHYIKTGKIKGDR